MISQPGNFPYELAPPLFQKRILLYLYVNIFRCIDEVMVPLYRKRLEQIAFLRIWLHEFPLSGAILIHVLAFFFS